MDAGQLVGDDVMIGIVRERLGRTDARNGFVLDGFPRTVVQAGALDEMMADRGPLVVVDIVVPEDVLVRRLAARRICGECGSNALVEWTTTCGKCGGALVQRTDDGDGIVRERLKVYQRQTKPLVDFYSGRPTFRTIDGNQPPDVVTAALDAAICQASAARRRGARCDRLQVAGGDRAACARRTQLVAQVLGELAAMVAPGVTTADLDAAAETSVRAAGAEPAFKGYRGYPATLCASVNDQVVHGIPSQAPLREGDIVSLDMGVKLDGFFGDSAVTVPVGTVDDDVKTLLRVTQEALEKGIAQVRVGGRISDIGHAIQQHVEAHGFSVVREFVGHGIGAALHEEPQIANYGEPGRGPRLAEGMTLAIEPMVNMGKRGVKVLADGWTAVTTDGSLSAHFEHTVAVTKDGPLVMTLRPMVESRVVAGAPVLEKDPREIDRAAISVEGIVREALPYAQYRVEIDGAAGDGARAERAGAEFHPRPDRRSGAAGAEPDGPDARADRGEARSWA